MRRACLLAASLTALAVACGSSPPKPATVQSVALQPADLPSGMIVCGLSGDVDQFLKAAPANNAYATDLEQQWTAMKQQGAQKGYVRVFAASKDQCTSAFTAQSLTGIKWAASMVVQFKNSSAATKAYGQAQAGAAEIAAAPGAEVGTVTGLGAHSLTFGDTSGSQAIFFGYWQGGRFLVVMLTLNVPESKARQASRNVNSRIH